eukprot:TRINITY_DN15257_c0_g2_i8.p1 TRINITY_DN15257_c0_g2~~TRINITY_DN15257_c0_g2_i8.p1  ORF type:complete len:440 (-),score=42.37 TRINITY_DN15257_c0_g2_i8:112-1431(-)
MDLRGVGYLMELYPDLVGFVPTSVTILKVPNIPIRLNSLVSLTITSLPHMVFPLKTVNFPDSLTELNLESILISSIAFPNGLKKLTLTDCAVAVATDLFWNLKSLETLVWKDCRDWISQQGFSIPPKDYTNLPESLRTLEIDLVVASRVPPVCTHSSFYIDVTPLTNLTSLSLNLVDLKGKLPSSLTSLTFAPLTGSYEHLSGIPLLSKLRSLSLSLAPENYKKTFLRAIEKMETLNSLSLFISRTVRHLSLPRKNLLQYFTQMPNLQHLGLENMIIFSDPEYATIRAYPPNITSFTCRCTNSGVDHEENWSYISAFQNLTHISSLSIHANFCVPNLMQSLNYFQQLTSLKSLHADWGCSMTFSSQLSLPKLRSIECNHNSLQFVHAPQLESITVNDLFYSWTTIYSFLPPIPYPPTLKNVKISMQNHPVRSEPFISYK